MRLKDPGGSMSSVVGLPYNSYKPITNTAWVCVRLFRLQKGRIWLTAASDIVYQLLAHGRWFSQGTPASSTTETGRHDIADILLKLELNTKNQIMRLSYNLLSYNTLLYFISQDSSRASKDLTIQNLECLPCIKLSLLFTKIDILRQNDRPTS